jgi:hypothetical protein
MSTILKKPKSLPIPNEGRYEKFNLKENPFPANPAINKNNLDIRYNGDIYENKIREKELNKIVEYFLKTPQSEANHIRIGYLLDASYVGRGNGKSAFSLDLIKKINKEFLLDISNEQNKCFGVHISPEPSGRTKSFYNFIDLIFEGILNQGIINYCLASIRLEGILKQFPEFDIATEFSSDNDLIEKLNSQEWFKGKQIIIADLSNLYFDKNVNLNKLSNDFPLNRDKKGYYNFRVTTQDDIRMYYYETLKKGKDRIDFFFSELIFLFKASGFNGAYLIIDDFERIPDFQSDRSKRDFALELRTNFFDGISENAKIGFYNLILILHAGVPRLLEKAWSDTGMERRSPLSDENYEGRHIVLFDKLNIEHARLLIKKYLDIYRIEDNLIDELFPFTEKAITLLSEKAEMNAASILEKSYELIERAVETDIKLIDEVFVKDYFGQNKSKEEAKDDNENEESTNLFEKANDK